MHAPGWHSTSFSAFSVCKINSHKLNFLFGLAQNGNEVLSKWEYYTGAHPGFLRRWYPTKRTAQYSIQSSSLSKWEVSYRDYIFGIKVIYLPANFIYSCRIVPAEWIISSYDPLVTLSISWIPDHCVNNFSHFFVFSYRSCNTLRCSMNQESQLHENKFNSWLATCSKRTPGLHCNNCILIIKFLGVVIGKFHLVT